MRNPQRIEQRQRQGMHLTLGKAAGAEAAEALPSLTPTPEMVHQAFGQDAAGGVAGAEEEHVADSGAHRGLFIEWT